MAITKIENENSTVYSLGDEKVLVATFEKEEKLVLKIKGFLNSINVME